VDSARGGLRDQIAQQTEPLGRQTARKPADAREIAAPPIEARNQAGSDRVDAG
jgi:hypothetical protein